MLISSADTSSLHARISQTSSRLPAPLLGLDFSSTPTQGPGALQSTETQKSLSCLQPAPAFPCRNRVPAPRGNPGEHRSPAEMLTHQNWGRSWRFCMHSTPGGHAGTPCPQVHTNGPPRMKFSPRGAAARPPPLATPGEQHQEPKDTGTPPWGRGRTRGQPAPMDQLGGWGQPHPQPSPLSGVGTG